MTHHKPKIYLSLSVFFFTAFFLTFIQLKVENPLLMLERFVPCGGWFEIFLLAAYGAIVAWNMHDPARYGN